MASPWDNRADLTPELLSGRPDQLSGADTNRSRLRVTAKRSISEACSFEFRRRSIPLKNCTSQSRDLAARRHTLVTVQIP